MTSPAPAPTYSRTLERVYGRLPDHYREADERLGYPLKRYLSGVADRAGELEVLLDRIDYVNRADRAASRERLTAAPEVLVADGQAFTRLGAWTANSGTQGPRVYSTAGGARLEWEVLLAGGTYRVELDYEQNVDRGIGYVSLGNAGTDVDEYGPLTGITNRVVLDGVKLDRGYALLRFENTGRRQDAATGTIVDLRRVTLRNTAPLTTAQTDTSDLVDPDVADDAWLGWLGQLVGVQLAPGLTALERRDAVRYASSGLYAGSKRAVADAARSELIGSRFARVYDHSTAAATGIGNGGPWDVLVVTRATETPSGAAVVAAIRRKGAAPAGVTLYHRAYEATWDTLETQRATWDQLEAAATWDRLQETGL